MRHPLVRWLAALVLTVLAFAGSAVPAIGAPEDAARDLVNKGIELRRQGHHSEALDLFVKAHEMSSSARTLAQIASAEATLRRWIDAETHLEQALAYRDSAYIDPRMRQALEESLTQVRKQIGTLRLQGTPGAQVSLDGKPAGMLPLAASARVNAGRARVLASAPGKKTLVKDVDVVGGAEIAVDLILEPTVPVVAAAPSSAAVGSVAMSAVPMAEASAPRPSWRVWTGGALIVTGVVGVGLGTTWLIYDGRPDCSPPSGSVCELVYDAKTRGWIALGAGAGVALVGLGLLLWPEAKPASNVAISVGPGTVILRGRF